MRLTKEEFCSAVDLLKEMTIQNRRIAWMLGIFDKWTLDSWINNYYQLLRKMCDFDETADCEDDLSYYCFKLDFGRRWTPGTITIDGVDIPCRNAEELWNLITGENLNIPTEKE